MQTIVFFDIQGIYIHIIHLHWFKNSRRSLQFIHLKVRIANTVHGNTVDGSVIRRSPPGMYPKPVVNHGDKLTTCP